MKKLLNIFCILFSVILATSCYKKYDVDAPQPVTYLVSTISSGCGRVYVNGEELSSAIKVEENTEVEFEAIADEGCYFEKWMSGDRELSIDNPYKMLVLSDVILTAVFKEREVEKVTISVVASDGGIAEINGVSSVDVEQGSNVTLVAKPSEGYEFINWTIEDVVVSTEKEYTFKAEENTTYKANFVKKVVNYTVSVESTEGGNAIVNGALLVEVEEGTSVTLTAIPNSGYEFVNWTTNGVEVSISATFQATVNSDVTYKANFVKKVVNYTVSVESTEGGNAIVNGALLVEVEEGTSVTLTAIPNSGYEFVNWTTNGVEVSISATFQAIVNSDVTYKANFAEYVVDSPSEILNLIEMNYISSIYVSKTLVTKELWNAVMKYSEGMNSVDNLVFSTTSGYASNVTYNDIIDVFIPRLNMITGRKFRLPTTSEMSVVASSVKFASPVEYVWCSNYKDEVNLYSSGPDSPDIPAIPTTRLLFSENGEIVSINMDYKYYTIGLVLISDNY